MNKSAIVVRRLNGSSSTASITKFLLDSCPDHWPAGLVGKIIDLPSETVIVDGSGAMSEKIRTSPLLAYNSDKIDKTAAVSVDRFRLNKKYDKKIHCTCKFLMHNVPEDTPSGSPVAGRRIGAKEPDKPAKLGDTVLIAPGQKLSKRKAHYVYRILMRTPQLWD
mmetsp:Transcript_35136/g.69279  ORF Transcript_35136/g.69279 Transcript_35136/m.69279 type:complete len:164 (+) Transcript_35136:106-597(+)